MKYDVIVIGGGASGMAAAICAARKGSRVCLLEKNAKPGKKLSVTGNGKCNLTNRILGAEQYHEPENGALSAVLKQYGTDDILAFFRELGICCKERNGYYYPMSEQASSVVQLLEAELRRLSVEIHCPETVTELFVEASGLKTVYTSSGSKYASSQVILAMGGMAAPVYGAEATGYRILKQLGHTVKQPLPALVQLTAKEKYIKKISGVRTEATVTLVYGKQKKIITDTGEIIFTDRGVSGIPVFQISRFCSQSFAEGIKELLLTIDLFPRLTEEDLKIQLTRLIQHNQELPLEFLFRGICNYKLVYAILTEQGYSAEQPCRTLSQKQLNALVTCFKQMTLTINGTGGFEQAQVTCGGVLLEEVKLSTMESLKIPGLYITGELLDVDGICGGYNLHFAFASGIIAGSHIKTGTVGTPGSEKQSPHGGENVSD